MKNKFDQYLEMAQASDFSSGAMKDRRSINLARGFRQGGETYDLPEGRKFNAVGPVSGKALSKGMLVAASYNQYNQGMQIYEILGVTGDEVAYGEGGVKFDSVINCLRHYRAKSLSELEAIQDKNEYGHGSYLVVKDIEDGSTGPWFYLFEGRWARGSGAEKLTFTRVEEVNDNTADTSERNSPAGF